MATLAYDFPWADEARESGRLAYAHYALLPEGEAGRETVGMIVPLLEKAWPGYEECVILGFVDAAYECLDQETASYAEDVIMRRLKFDILH